MGMKPSRLSTRRKTLEMAYTPPLIKRYNRTASTWDARISALGFEHAYRETVRRSLRPLPKAAHVLDIGVGTGALSLALAHHYPAARVTGVDLSSGMLREAHRHFQRAGVSFCAYLADASTLPLRANAFDAVVSAHLLEHLPDPNAALREALRVLKPGAPLLLIVTRRSLPGRFVRRQWGIHLYTPEEVTDLVMKAGFTDAKRVDLRGSPLPH